MFYSKRNYLQSLQEKLIEHNSGSTEFANRGLGWLDVYNQKTLTGRINVLKQFFKIINVEI